MPALLSGAKLNPSSPTGYATLGQVQFQLGATPTTSTGYTLIANSSSQVTYASSLGNIQFENGEMFGNLPNLQLVLSGTGTNNVLVVGSQANTSTNTGVLVVQGGIGIANGFYTGQDVNINGLTVGQGYQSLSGGVNNIVITAPATPQLNNFPNGQENVVIGYSALQGISTAYKSIAIGRNAASSGTLLQNTIAIGDSALMKIGTTQTQFAGTITGATQALPVILTVPHHTVNTGTEITIVGVGGMTQLNGNNYYAKVLSTSTIALYTDNILGNPVDGRGFTAYTTGGGVAIDLVWNNNFAIGTNAGTNLINGTENFFLGYNITPSFTTGSYNFFLGHEIGLNMTNGNSNISIGGDNLVDGLDNQVNIGSVFYYNGSGYLELNADTAVGYGTTATSTTFAAMAVLGGIGVTDNAIIGGPVKIQNYVESSSVGSGSLVVNGGVGISGNVNIAKALSVSGNGAVTLNPQAASVFITPTLGGTVEIYPNATNPSVQSGSMDNVVIGANTPTFGSFTNILIGGGTSSTSISSGALVVQGGAGISGDLWLGGILHANISGGATSAAALNGGSAGALVYQTAPGFTGFLTIGPAGSILTSNGSTPYWSTSTTATNVNVVTAGTATYYAAFVTTSSGGSAIDASQYVEFIGNTKTFAVTSTATSTSTTTGALTVTGGVGVQGSVYSQDGNPLQNYLLYTPKVTVTNTGIPPANPNIGDFWIDTVAAGQLQFIQDGTSTFWIQITTI